MKTIEVIGRTKNIDWLKPYGEYAGEYEYEANNFISQNYSEEIKDMNSDESAWCDIMTEGENQYVVYCSGEGEVTEYYIVQVELDD